MLVIDGIKRIINSAKAQTAAVAAFGAWVTYYASDGTPIEKQPLKIALLIAVGSLVGIVLVAWAAEDYATKKAQGPAKPDTQVNLGVTRVDNTSNAPAPAPEPIIAEPTLDDHIRELARIQRENATTLNLLLKNIRITKPVAAPQTEAPPHEPEA